MYEVFAARPAGQLEDILAPFCDCPVRLVDVFDVVCCFTSAHFEDQGGHRIEGREFSKDAANRGRRDIGCCGWR